ncbi:hypothetical protein HC891_13295 [Candidatus Gracilibacteria bacterium]|nr:hypothetical protein [Candidatus Gracilibacteria bacterium]
MNTDTLTAQAQRLYDRLITYRPYLLFQRGCAAKRRDPRAYVHFHRQIVRLDRATEQARRRLYRRAEHVLASYADA